MSIKKYTCVYKNSDIGSFLCAKIFEWLISNTIKKDPESKMSFYPIYDDDDQQDLFDHIIKFSDKKTILYVLGFSFSLEKMIQLKETSALLIWNDRIQEPFDNKNVLNFIIGGNRYIDQSALLSTYTYFFGDEDIPEWVMAIDRRESGKCSYTDLHFYLGIKSYCENYLPIVSFDDLDNNYAEYIARGKIIADHIENQVYDYNNDYIKLNIAGYPIFALSSTQGIASEIASKMATVNNIGAAFWLSGDRVFFSLKKNYICDIDLISIAKKYGGSGTKRSVNFNVTFKTFTRMMIKA